MKKLTIVLICGLLCTSVLLTSCGKDSKNGDASGDSKLEDNNKETTDNAVETDENGYVRINVESDDDLVDINQMLDYEIDHVDLSSVQAGEGGDITGVWFSDIMKVQMELDNNPDTVDYMSYRAAFSFHEDGTGVVRIYLGEENIEIEYTLDGKGGIDIKGERLSLPNAKYTVSDDGKYLVFTSDTLSANFMKIG